MTDIEQKALALENEVNVERGYAPYGSFRRDFDNTCEALCRAIEQHEAFRQEVSNVVHNYVYADGGPDDWGKLKALIIPKPKPDPLVEALADCGVDRFESWADQLRAALDARGLEIREKNDD